MQGSGEGRAWCKLRLLTVLKSIKSFFFYQGCVFEDLHVAFSHSFLNSCCKSCLKSSKKKKKKCF